MKLIDTDVPGHEEEPPIRVTVSVPEKRRAAVSLLFTLAVLGGTVGAVFRLFPARDREIVDEAVESHRHPGRWELENPDDAQLQAWAIGALGLTPPLPAAPAMGARSLTILRHRSAVIRYRLPEGEVTYLVQRSRELRQRGLHLDDESLAIDAGHLGEWSRVTVGPAATASTWQPRLVTDLERSRR